MRGSRCTSWCESTWVGSVPVSSRNRASWRSHWAATPSASESPASSSKWRPTLTWGCWRASAAAAPLAGRSTRRLALVRIPSRCAWMMPRLIPWLAPKSSPLMMSHFMDRPRPPAGGALRRRVEVRRQMRRRVRHALEARDAGHIHDVCLSLALDQVDAVQVDTERTATAQGDVGLLGSRGERLAVLLRLRDGREDLPDAEEPLADHVDLQVAPLGRVIALC